MAKIFAKARENLNKPLRFTFFLVLYLLVSGLTTRVFQLTVVSRGLIAFFGLLMYGWLYLFCFDRIQEASQGKRSSGNALMDIVLSAISGMVFFAFTYFLLENNAPGSFSGHLGTGPLDQLITFLYYSVVTFATIGYGDIAPMTSLARIVVMGEILYSMFIIIMAVSSFGALQEVLKDKPSVTKNRLGRHKPKT